jgi:ubiquinone/menaquinone biosynthesis C-methylase UbiE
MLGSYPGLSFDRSRYPGGKILDVGFGDGRNWPLLRNIGLKIHGVEITDEIVALGRQRAARLGIAATLETGRNARLPFEDEFFEYVLACHSCYYVDKGTTFEDNVREAARVLKKGGYYIASLGEQSASIYDNSEDIGNGHVVIRNDPWGLRNGYVFKVFRTKDEVVESLSGHFKNFSIGRCTDEYFGPIVSLFIVVCEKK